MSISSPSARTRKPRGQGASRRGEILAAAKKLFLEQGVEHATMRRIAAELGISSTALYVYFPDKPAILKAIAESMFEALLVAYSESQASDQAPLPRFRAGLRAYVDLALARPDEYRLTFGAHMLDGCKDIAAADMAFEMLHRNVAVLMQAGLFVPGDPLAVAEALWACLHGMVLLLLNQPEHLATEPQNLITTVMDIIMRGVETSN
jgi:AcrR family transcriptional regulator